MTRLSTRRYQRQSMLAMVAYVALLLLVWPLARTAPGFAIRPVLALTPVLPMLWLFALMARHIRDSDELEQRMHLMALGAATMVTAALSMVGGFLVAAHVVQLDGSILIWVFPLVMASYGLARSVLMRRYGGEMFACDGDSAVPMPQRLLLVAVMMAGVALFAYVKHDRQAWGMFLAMACIFGAAGAVTMLRRWRTANAARMSKTMTSGEC